MTTTRFIHESAVYHLLSSAGLKVPTFASYKEENDLRLFPFKSGEAVVVKGLGEELWHKSDVGALHFIDYSPEKIIELDSQMRKKLHSHYPWIETMVCSRARFKSAGALPSEGFVSIQRDDACKTVISFGVGGIHAEAWALELGSGVLMWSPEIVTPEMALLDIKKHWLGKVWLGELRQGKKLTEESLILQFLKGLWTIALSMEEKKIDLLEMNPVVVDEDGSIMALDGVGTMAEPAHPVPSVQVNSSAMLTPKKVAIAGVSDSASSFGKRILVNLMQSNLGPENITIIKPNAEEFLGLKCFPDVKTLKVDPVDILILVLPAALTVSTLLELCEQGGGADIVYIVAGGIGDGGDSKGHAETLHRLLKERRERGLWTPSLIGPNSLGIVLSSLKLNTLFIAPKKLPVNFHPDGNIAFVSQSGAFFITRLSREPNLKVKYGFCIGNQMDLKVSDFLNATSTDPDVSIFAVYIEGFGHGEVLRLAKTAQKLIKEGKHVIVYRGGKSDEGMKAAAGHTGSMAGNFEMQNKLLLQAGVYIADTFLEFSSIINNLSVYPQFKGASNVAVISNAGFETVASADNLGSVRSRKNRMMVLDERTKKELEGLFVQRNLSGLVGAANPLDLTPMADFEVYLESADILAKSSADAILYCVVPLTDNLDTENSAKMDLFACGLKEIAKVSSKPILVIIDSGEIYNLYREAFKKAGLPTFSSIEEGFLALKYEGRPLEGGRKML